MAETPNIISAKARAKTRPAGAPVAASPIVVPIAGLQATVKLLDLAPGLYAVTIEAAGVPEADLGGMILPATLVTPVGTDPNRAEIFGAGTDGGSWIGPAGGTVVLRIPAGGGRSLITTYRSAQQEVVPLSIQIAALSRPTPRAEPAHRSNGAPPENPVPIAEPTLPAEVTFCIDNVAGQVVAGNWAGEPGSKRFLEAFAIAPQGEIDADGIEYKGFGPGGRETPWVSAGKLCGSRGKKVALTGFAIRPAEHLRDKIDVVYEGAFATSGLSGTRRNGESCRGTRSDEPLEALSVRIVARA
jgi:hypothetical protein